MLLSRYKYRQISCLTLCPRSNSSTILNRLPFHSSHIATLTPMTDAPKVMTPSSQQEPIDELGVPMTMTTVEIHRNKHHKDIQLTKLPRINEPIDSKSIPLIEEKLTQCKTMCDYSDNEADLSAKNIKTQSLIELVSIFDTSSYYTFFTPTTIDKLFEMIETNIFRPIPLVPEKYLFFNDEPYITEVNWPHLQYVYDILNKFITNSPKDKHLTPEFMEKITNLLIVPDANERDCIVKFIITYLGIYTKQTEKVITQISYLLVGYIDGVYGPFPVNPAFKIFEKCFEADPTNNFYQKIFETCVLPIASSKHLMSFYQPFTKIIGIMLKSTEGLAVSIFTYIIRKFPESKPSKQVIYFKLLNFVVGKMSQTEFESISSRLFKLLAQCAKSSNSKVVEASFLIWSDIKIIPLILDNSGNIFPLIYTEVYRTMKEHWNNYTRTAALNTIKSMHDIDSFYFDEISNGKEQNMYTKEESEISKLQKKWAMVARAAAQQDRDVNLSRKLAEISTTFCARIMTKSASSVNTFKKKNTSKLQVTV